MPDFNVDPAADSRGAVREYGDTRGLPTFGTPNSVQRVSDVPEDYPPPSRQRSTAEERAEREAIAEAREARDTAARLRELDDPPYEPEQRDEAEEPDQELEGETPEGETQSEQREERRPDEEPPPEARSQRSRNRWSELANENRDLRRQMVEQQASLNRFIQQQAEAAQRAAQLEQERAAAARAQAEEQAYRDRLAAMNLDPNDPSYAAVYATNQRIAQVQQQMSEMAQLMREQQAQAQQQRYMGELSRAFDAAAKGRPVSPELRESLIASAYAVAVHQRVNDPVEAVRRAAGPILRELPTKPAPKRVPRPSVETDRAIASRGQRGNRNAGERAGGRNPRANDPTRVIALEREWGAGSW